MDMIYHNKNIYGMLNEMISYNEQGCFDSNVINIYIYHNSNVVYNQRFEQG